MTDEFIDISMSTTMGVDRPDEVSGEREPPEENAPSEAGKADALMPVAGSPIVESSLRSRARSAPPSGLEGKNGLLWMVSGLSTDGVDGVEEFMEPSARVDS